MNRESTIRQKITRRSGNGSRSAGCIPSFDSFVPPFLLSSPPYPLPNENLADLMWTGPRNNAQRTKRLEPQSYTPVKAGVRQVSWVVTVRRVPCPRPRCMRSTNIHGRQATLLRKLWASNSRDIMFVPFLSFSLPAIDQLIVRIDWTLH